MPPVRRGTAIPVERFFTRENDPKALIRQLKADEKAAGRDPKLLKVKVGEKRVPLSEIEKDLESMWQDRFDPGALGRGAAFRPSFVIFPPLERRLTRTSASRLGKLSDEAIGKVKFSQKEALERLSIHKAPLGLMLFLARSCELGGPNAEWSRALLKRYFQQPLNLGEVRLDGTRDSEVARVWLRAARAIDLDVARLTVKAFTYHHGDDVEQLNVPLAALERFALRQEHAEETANSRGIRPPMYGGGPFDYSSAPGYGGGTAGYFPDAPAPARPGGLRLADPPPDVVLNPRPAPAPAYVRVPSRPIAVQPAPAPSTGGADPVDFTPPPPPPPASLPLASTPWEIIATPGASSFFEAKARGYDGSWEDWKQDMLNR